MQTRNRVEFATQSGLARCEGVSLYLFTYDNNTGQLVRIEAKTRSLKKKSKGFVLRDRSRVYMM